MHYGSNLKTNHWYMYIEQKLKLFNRLRINSRENLPDVFLNCIITLSDVHIVNQWFCLLFCVLWIYCSQRFLITLAFQSFDYEGYSRNVSCAHNLMSTFFATYKYHISTRCSMTTNTICLLVVWNNYLFMILNGRGVGLWTATKYKLDNQYGMHPFLTWYSFLLLRIWDILCKQRLGYFSGNPSKHTKNELKKWFEFRIEMYRVCIIFRYLSVSVVLILNTRSGILRYNNIMRVLSWS